MTLDVRSATEADAAACARIYAPSVLGSAASFETDAPGPEEMARRIAAALASWAWLVAELDQTVVGYAYATAYRTRAAYRWTCETSVYVAAGNRGLGVGHALYSALLPRLADLGYRSVVAGMALPNPASAALHAAFGFRPVGVLEDVGWKGGRWHDVTLLQRSLGRPGARPPAGPRVTVDER